MESLNAQPEALPAAEAAGSSGQRAGQEGGPQVTALMAYLQDKHSLKKRAPVTVARTRGEAKTERVSFGSRLCMDRKYGQLKGCGLCSPGP